MEKNYQEYKAALTDLMRKYGAAQPGVMGAFSQVHKNALVAGENGALPTKIRELMALSIAIAIRCEGCIAFHISDAIKAGATRQEVLETISVAVAMGGGPAVVYGAHAMAALEQFAPAA